MFKKLKLTNTGLNLLYYLSLQKKPQYSKQIAKATETSIGSTSQNLRNLFKKNLIKSEIKGKEKYYYIDSDEPFIKYLKLSLNILSITNLTNNLNQFSTKIILFGSYATGLNTEESDIDLLILTLDKEKINQILNEYKSYLKISSIILSNMEYILLKDKDKPLYEEINKGIILWSKKDEKIWKPFRRI